MRAQRFRARFFAGFAAVSVAVTVAANGRGNDPVRRVADASASPNVAVLASASLAEGCADATVDIAPSNEPVAAMNATTKIRLMNFMGGLRGQGALVEDGVGGFCVAAAPVPSSVRPNACQRCPT
mgnify:CR=1 FL=1